MWFNNWREETWSTISQKWDLIIVGGGITGAGIFREATHLGLRPLLLEQRDFAWGTSSRSSKLVHGGLRYLKEGKIGLTRDSVREREQLLKEAPGLVEPLDFLLASYDGDNPGRFTYRAGLTIYDLLALRWSHRYYSSQDFRLMAGQLSTEGLEGGFRYGDAKTDDARLVLRVIREGVASGGTALNYAKVINLLRDETGMVSGIKVRELESGREADISAPLIINATGAWADRLRNQIGAPPKIRPLRGSHLIFPSWRIPVAQAVSFLHPLDGRPVFLTPWRGVTLVGTTDVDYESSLDQEPGITGSEVAYLMAAVESRYPLLGVSLDDVISTFAGVRPVIGSGKENPSLESRDHVIWEEEGLLTVTGGKLTTFRLVAVEALNKACEFVPDLPRPGKEFATFEKTVTEINGAEMLDEFTRRRLAGYYGPESEHLIQAAEKGELDPIPGTDILWAELRWSARAEGVVHLDDLLLRRVRLGLLIKNGGQEHLERIRAICQPELGWDNARWTQEERIYLALWKCCYSLPPRSKIPNWTKMLRESKQEHAADTARKKEMDRKGHYLLLSTAAVLAIMIAFILVQIKSQSDLGKRN